MSPFWRRTRVVVLAAAAAAVVLVLVAVGLVVGWLQTTSRAAAQVSVTWVPTGSSCTGDALGRTPPGLGFGGPMLFMGRGTRCRLQVLVVNGSTHPVTLDWADGDLLGRRGSPIIKALDADANVDLGVDARWRLGRRLAPGGVYRFTVAVGYRASGCSQAFTSLENFPVVHLTVWHRGLSRFGTRPLRWVQRGPSRGCRTTRQH